jgi:hypothetical protein
MPVSPTRFLSLILILLPATASAQPQRQLSAGAGVAYSGEDRPATYIFGAAERISSSAISVGGDGSLLFGGTGRPGERLAWFTGSLWAGIHGARSQLVRDAPIEAFGLAGLALVTDPDCCGGGVGLTFGAGLILWFNDRLGLRSDVRLTTSIAGEGGFLSVGTALTFRTLR